MSIQINIAGLPGRPLSGVMLLCAVASGFIPASAVAADGTPAAPAPASAADQTVLPEVLVLGKLLEGDDGHPGKSPLLTTTTDRKTIEDLQIDSLADYARRLDAGININSENNSVEIRGLDQNRVVTMIDGIRTPWIDDGARGVKGGVNMFDFDSLRKIDVVKTSDSSAFGTGALGGVLALHTLDPEDVIKAGRKTGGISKLSYNSADTDWQLDQAVAGHYGDTWILFQGGYRSGGELRNKGTDDSTGKTRTKPNPADYNNKNFLFKLHQYIADDHRISLTADSFSSDKTENTLTDVGVSSSSAYTRYYNKRRRVSLGYDYLPTNPAGWVDRAHVVGYWQRMSMDIESNADRTQTPEGPFNRDSLLKETAYGVSGYLKTRFETGEMIHAASFGGDIRSAETSQYSGGQDSCPPGPYPPFDPCSFFHTNQSDMPDVDSIQVGAFAQDRIGVYKDRVHLTFGLRYDWFRHAPRHTESYEANADYDGMPGNSSGYKFSPKIMAEWEIVPDATVYAQWSQSFRAPSPTELYMNYGAPGLYVQLGNENLKPETSNGFEVGARLGDDELGGQISVYDNYYHDYIDTVAVDPDDFGLDGYYPLGVTAYVNRAHVHIYGTELKGHWRFSKYWRVWGSLAYTVGKDTDRNEYLNSIPPLKGIVGLGYEARRYGGDITATAAARRDKIERASSDVNKTPGYAIFDVTGWWKPAFFDGVRLQAGVYNLFDKQYYNALNIPDDPEQPQAFFSEPGRYYKLTLRYEF